MNYTLDELQEIVDALEEANYNIKFAMEALSAQRHTDPWFAAENAAEVIGDYLEFYRRQLDEAEQLERDAMNREYERMVL